MINLKYIIKYNINIFMNNIIIDYFIEKINIEEKYIFSYNLILK